MVKYSPANAGEAGGSGLIPGWGRSLVGGRGTPLQYSCLENPMDRGAWRAAVPGVTASRTRLTECTGGTSSGACCRSLFSPLAAVSFAFSTPPGSPAPVLLRALLVLCSLNLQQPSVYSVGILAVLPERRSALSASPDYDDDSQISILEANHPPSHNPLSPDL